MKKKCLITGAGGLLGSHVLPLLQDYEVIVLSKTKDDFSEYCHVVDADLTEEGFCDELPQQIDVVIHLAQSNHYRSFPEKAMDIAAVNSMSTLRLLDYAKNAGAEHFIYASTGGVYPAGKGICLEAETLSLQQHGGMYYASKLSGELFVDAYAHLMTTVSLRFFFIYGPGQRKTMLIPRLVQSVVDGQPIMLQGVDGIRINPVYAADAAQAVCAAIKMTSSGVVNVAGPEILSLRDIGEVIGEEVGKKPFFQEDLSKEPLDLVGGIDKMKQVLLQPVFGFRKGLSMYLQDKLPETVRR